MDVKEYMNEHRERMLGELLELLRIPSISADPAYAKDTHRCAEVVAEHLRNAGADNVEVVPTKGYPVVYGEKLVDPSKPTVLVYGHYDVQPADPIDLWDSPCRRTSPSHRRQGRTCLWRTLCTRLWPFACSGCCTTRQRI